MIFENKTRAYFKEANNYYKIISYLTTTTIHISVTAFTDVKEDIIEEVTVIRKNGEVRRWFFIKTGFKPTKGHFKLFDSFEDLYRSLNLEEKLILDEYINAVKTPETHEKLLYELKRIATKTKVDEKWFNDSPFHSIQE